MRPARRALTGALSALCLCACAGKVNLNPEGPLVGAGAYRARTVSQDGGSGHFLELKRDGRFALRTYRGGCFLAEDLGTWAGAEESLELQVKERHSRAGCGSAWATEAKDEVHACPLRNRSARSFHMLHDEIGQGSTWIEWSQVAPGRLVAAPEAGKDTTLSAALW